MTVEEAMKRLRKSDEAAVASEDKFIDVLIREEILKRN
jgi:hypothetical protein